MHALSFFEQSPDDLDSRHDAILNGGTYSVTVAREDYNPPMPWVRRFCASMTQVSEEELHDGSTQLAAEEFSGILGNVQSYVNVRSMYSDQQNT